MWWCLSHVYVCMYVCIYVCMYVCMSFRCSIVYSTIYSTTTPEVVDSGDDATLDDDDDRDAGENFCSAFATRSAQ